MAALMKTAMPTSIVDPKIGSKDVVRIAQGGLDIANNETELARQILSRSAKLVAASLAGLIDQLNLISVRKNVCIVAEGSLFWGYDKYNKMTNETLRQLLNKMNYSNTNFEIAFFLPAFFGILFFFVRNFPIRLREFYIMMGDIPLVDERSDGRIGTLPIRPHVVEVLELALTKLKVANPLHVG